MSFVGIFYPGVNKYVALFIVKLRRMLIFLTNVILILVTFINVYIGTTKDIRNVDTKMF